MFGMFTVLGLTLLCSLPFLFSGSNDNSDPDPADDDILEGTDSEDTLIGTSETKLIDAGAGDDDITAEDFTDIEAGAGNDTIEAGGGAMINAGDGNDQIIAGGESDIDAGAGDDIVTGQGGSTVAGGDGDDTLRGAGLDSTLDGGAGDDVIGAGPNVLLTTGTGADSVTVNAGFPLTGEFYNAGPVTVTDYVAGQDTYRINGTYEALEAGGYDQGTLAFAGTPAGVVVTLDGARLMFLRGVALADVDQRDFVPDLPPVFPA